jgi:hypothetical protein
LVLGEGVRVEVVVEVLGLLEGVEVVLMVVLWMIRAVEGVDMVFLLVLLYHHGGFLDRLDGRAWLSCGRILLAYWLKVINSKDRVNHLELLRF